MSLPNTINNNDNGPQPIASDLSNQTIPNVQDTPASQQPTVQPSATQPGQMVSNPATPPNQTQPEVSHPAIKQAGILHSIAETLAGGPRYRPVISADGTRSLQRIPMDRKDIGMAIALSAITGALSGLQARGPNASAQAAGLGFKTTSQMRQQADEEQETEAKEDFQRKQNSLVQKAGLTEANLRLYQNALQAGKMDEEFHKAFVDNYADQRDAMGTPSYEHISEAEIKSGRYDVTKYLALPDGVVPRLDSNGSQVKDANGVPQWDNTYSLFDQTTQVPLHDAVNMDKAVRAGLPGFVKSDGSPMAIPDHATISANLAAITNHKLQMLDGLQSELNSIAKGASSDKNKFTALDVYAAVKKDASLLQAIQHAQRALSVIDTGDPKSVNAAFVAMAQDPHAAPYVGRIKQLFGADMLNAYAEKKAAALKEADATATGERQKNLAEANKANQEAKNAANQSNAEVLTTPDVLGFTPNVPGGLKEYNKRQGTFKKNADDLSKTEGTYQQFNDILKDINAGKDMTGAQSVVGLFNAIGISATPLKGAGFRINNNTIQEHAEARGLGESLYQKLLSLKAGDVITPQQLKDYAAIAQQARESQYVNLVNQVHNQGLNADFVLPTGNGNTVDPSTARIFVKLCGGDLAKAAAAMKAKGWLIPNQR